MAHPSGLPLLVLDLDETLIYAHEQPLARPCEFRVGPYHVYRRPGLFDFLNAMARHYRLAVWTSSGAQYADGVVAALFPDPTTLAFVWSRNRCTPTRDFATDTWIDAKPLRKLKRQGFDLRRVLIVDDSPEKHGRNYGNLVRVRAWLGDPDDDELPALVPYLASLADQPDFRRIEKRGWRQRS